MLKRWLGAATAVLMIMGLIPQAAVAQIDNTARGLALKAQTAVISSGDTTRINAAFGSAQQASNRPTWPANPALADTVSSVRVPRLLVNGATSLRFVYSGSYKGGTGEDPLPNPIHVKTGIETVLGSIQPVTFGGKLYGTVMPGGLLVSDPVGVGAVPGATIYERTTVSPPMAPVITPTASTAGGTLGAGTYYYKVTSITEGGGESLASAEVSAVTTGTTSSVTLSIGDRNMLYVPVLGYNVYRGTSAGAETLLAQLKSNDRTFTDLGANLLSVTTTTTASGVTRQPTLASTAGVKAGDVLVFNGTTSAKVLQVLSTTQVAVDTNVTAVSGQSVALTKIPPTTTTSISNFSTLNNVFPNEGTRAGYDLAHQDNGFSFINAIGGGAAAVAVLASPAKSAPGKPVIILLGDSIMNGTGWVGQTSYGRGFGNYALNDAFPYLNLSTGGETAASFSNLTHSANRLALAALGKYAIDDYGTNDLTVGGAPAIKGYILTTAKRVIAQGLIYYRTTIIPRSGSTDGWQTYTNQAASSTDADRQIINQYLRAPASAGAGNSIRADLGALAPFYGVFDTAAQVETNSDGSPIVINPTTGAVANGIGGYWKIFGSTQYDSKTGTTSGTTSTLVDSAKTWTTNQWTGYMLASTNSGVTQYTEIASNSANTLTLNGTITAPTSGTTYYIYKGPTIDGIHPTDFEHMVMATAIDISKFN